MFSFVQDDFRVQADGNAGRIVYFQLVDFLQGCSFRTFVGYIGDRVGDEMQMLTIQDLRRRLDSALDYLAATLQKAKVLNPLPRPIEVGKTPRHSAQN